MWSFMMLDLGLHLNLFHNSIQTVLSNCLLHEVHVEDYIAPDCNCWEWLEDHLIGCLSYTIVCGLYYVHAYSFGYVRVTPPAVHGIFGILFNYWLGPCFKYTLRAVVTKHYIMFTSVVCIKVWAASKFELDLCCQTQQSYGSFHLSCLHSCSWLWHRNSASCSPGSQPYPPPHLPWSSFAKRWQPDLFLWSTARDAEKWNHQCWTKTAPRVSNISPALLLWWIEWLEAHSLPQHVWPFPTVPLYMAGGHLPTQGVW